MIKRLCSIGVMTLLALITILPQQAKALDMNESNKELYEVRTLSGNGEEGAKNGLVKDALFDSPHAIVQLDDGSFLLTDSGNHLIRQIKNGQVSTYIGKMLDIVNGEVIGSYLDGTKDEAFFDEPTGIAITVTDEIIIADRNNHAIRKISKDGTVTTIAGNGVMGHVDGKGAEAQFNAPSDVAVDSKGNIYVADTLNHAIRKIDQDGNVTTIHARSTKLFEYISGAVTSAGEWKDGALKDAKFNAPTSLVVDGKGNLYVSDTGNQRIRYIDFTENVVLTVAGGGELLPNELYVIGDYKDGQALQARFSSPTGISLTKKGELLIADTNNHVIRLLREGIVTTIAGQPEDHGFVSGVIGSAKLDKPTDVIETKDGKLIVVDSGNHAARAIQKYEVELPAIKKPYQIFIDGKYFEIPTIVQKDRTLVQLRALAEYFDYEVKYNATNHEAMIQLSADFTITVAPKKQLLTVRNGARTENIQVPIAMEKDRMYVPIRFVANALNYDVQWDAEYSRVVVRSKVFK